MQNISIKNFGPIKHFDAKIKDIMFFIGPQASGKSTLSKSIFFFKNIKDELMKFIYEIEVNYLARPIEDSELALTEFIEALRKRFVEFFGPTNHIADFLIVYHYAHDKTATLSLKNRQAHINFNVKIDFNDNILDKLRQIFRFVIEYNQKLSKINRHIATSDWLRAESEKKNYLRTVEEQINNLFEDKRTPIFIPAGRSLVATLAEQIQNINPHMMDFCMKSFIERINHLRPFKEDLLSLIEDKNHLVTVHK
jgi:AAA15 family ATPase/GTPase